MAKRPEDYFRLASRLYSQLRYPDMTALARRPDLTAGQFAQAFAAVNPGWRADMVRVGASDGWLDELWLCLDRKLRPAQCPAHQGGVGASARLRIWRGGR
jgi:ribonuclease T2